MRIPFAVLPAGSRPFDVVGFGLNSMDLLVVVPRFPESDTKLAVERAAYLPGGQIATATVACARLGWKARYIGTFGGDDLGRAVRESLAVAGIDLEGARTVAGTTNEFAVILVDARSGARTVLWHRDENLAMSPADVSRELVCAGRILIVDSFDTAAASEAARLSRAAGMVTIVDVEAVRPGVGDLLSHIDAIIAAEEFPRELTDHADLGRALEAIEREFHAPLVSVTLGAEGSLSRCGGREIRTPGFKVEAVDSTGAGDAFRAGFAAGCLRFPDGQIEDVLIYANAVAALNCRALGARAGLPTVAEVEALITRSA